MPAFSDSTLDDCGMDTTSSAWASTSFGTPAPSLPTTKATGPRRSVVGNRSFLCVTKLPVPHAARLNFGQRCRQLHLRRRHPEQRSRRSPHRFPVPRTHRSLAQQQSGHAEGLGRTRDRSQISRILQARRLSPTTPARAAKTSSSAKALHPHQRGHTLRRLGGDGAGEDRHRAAATASVCADN